MDTPSKRLRPEEQTSVSASKQLKTNTPSKEQTDISAVKQPKTENTSTPEVISVENSIGDKKASLATPKRQLNDLLTIADSKSNNDAAANVAVVEGPLKKPNNAFNSFFTKKSKADTKLEDIKQV